MVFDGLDSSLRAEWVSDDRVLVPGAFLLDTFHDSQRFTLESQGAWEFKGNFGPDLLLLLCVSALLHSSSGFLSCLSLHE